MTDEKTNPKIKMVYVGPSTTSDKKVGAVFYPLTDEQFRDKRLPDDLPAERLYTSVKGIGRPGTIYEYEYPEDKPTSIFPGTRRYAGFLENDPRVMQWQAEQDAFHVAKTLEQQEKKGKNRNLVQEQLAPIKVAYHKMVGHQRAAFLAQVIGYVTGRVTKEDEKRAQRTPSWDDE